MTFSRFHDAGLRRYVAPAVIAFMVTSCGGSTPNSPTTALMAPTVSSPEDDSIAAGRPSLTVNNPPASAGGARSYDFQVADSQAALTGPPDGLFASASGVAEGAGGRTTYQMTRDVQPGRRYFWRARAVQTGREGPWSSAFRFRTDSAGNAPPVIQAITVSPRAEARTELDVTAVVQDQETGPANLIYEWTAPAGSFSGSGASVRWLVPAITSPTVYDLSLAVIERYTVPVAGGGEETRENRASRTATVHVNDSAREITTLATTFIDDFVHSDRTPEFCLRNFSNSCPGKADELKDIQDNRRLFVNDPALSSSGSGSIGYYDIGDVVRRKAVPTSQAGFAEFLAACRFARTTKATGVFGVVTGTCRLTSVYENWQWRLCDSNFLP